MNTLYWNEGLVTLSFLAGLIVSISSIPTVPSQVINGYSRKMIEAIIYSQFNETEYDEGQKKRLNNIIIQNFPETLNERITRIAIDIGHILGIGYPEKDIIKAAYTIAFPLKQKKIKKHYVTPEESKWYTPELGEMRRIYETLNIFAREEPTPLRISLRNQYRVKYRAAIKKARTLANDNKISHHPSPSKAMWEIVNAKRKTKKKKQEHRFAPD
ncbi:hypothetical protein WDU94_001683 [Cyamophila willieti]